MQQSVDTPDVVPAPTAAGDTTPTTLLLVLPVTIYRTGDVMAIDRQALNGLHRWLDNFDRMILCLPQAPLSDAPADTAPFDEADFAGRCRLVCMPQTFTPLAFLRALPATVALLDRLIDLSTHRSFLIGGLFGDWAAIGALRAARKGRAASVWTDRVEHSVAYASAQRKRGVRKFYWRAQAFGMKHLERTVIRQTALGLFHGADCYNAYARYSPNPHLVHDVHLKPEARIGPAELIAKQDRIRTGKPLSILYAGRVHPDKGPLDWIEALRLLAEQGVEFHATWHGDGPILEEARRAAAATGFGDRITFPGSLQDRELLMRNVRAADIFLFCHKTLESPRCLIEALLAGTPIVGYDSNYPRDLIKDHGGGLLTPHDPNLLAAAIAQLAADREGLAELARRAAADGYPMTDANVFKHRSDLIKQFA